MRNSNSMLLLSSFFSVLLFSFHNSCQNNSQETRAGKGGISAGGKLYLSKPISGGFLPYSINNLATAQVASAVLEGLTKVSSLGKPEPLLAEDFEFNEMDNSYTFKLRKGVFFHDNPCFKAGKGREVKASDVKFSFELLCKDDPENYAFSGTFKYLVEGAQEFYSGIFPEITGLKVLDDYTLTIRLTVKNEAFPLLLGGIQTAIIPVEAYNKYGNKAMVGTGPFSVKQQTETDMVLERNTRYYGHDAMGNQLPYLDEIILKNYASRQEEFEAFEKGELDVLANLTNQELKTISDEAMKVIIDNPDRYVKELLSEVSGNEQIIIRKENIRGYKAGSDMLINWALVYKHSTSD